MSVIYKICLVLLIVGGLNWGLVGLFDFNLVGWLFGGAASWLSRAIFTLVGVFLGMWLYSVMTRRGFLLWTFYLSAALLTIMILWTSAPPVMALVLVMILALILAISIVPEFSYPAELFPTELRGSGVGLTIAISRFGSGGGTFLLPIISAEFGIQAALWVCVATLLFGGIICQMWAPETSGKGRKAGA